MDKLTKQHYEIYLAGDLSRCYEYAFLCKDDNGWKVEITFCTPEKSGKEALFVPKALASPAEIDAYIDKLKKLFNGYKEKSLCYFMDEINDSIRAL